jgi:hypothetical protein
MPPALKIIEIRPFIDAEPAIPPTLAAAPKSLSSHSAS